MQFFFDEIVESFFVIGDPAGQLSFHDFPVIVFWFLHPENDAVAAVIRHIHMKQAIGIAGKQSEIEFAQAVGRLNQLCKMYIPHESEIHSVQFEPA